MTYRIDTWQYSTPRPALLHPAPEITDLGHCDIHSKQKNPRQTKNSNASKTQQHMELYTVLMQRILDSFSAPTLDI